MPTSRIRVNSLLAVIVAAATLLSYCLTSRALESQPSEVGCINTLDLSALSHLNSTSKNPKRFVALTCGQEVITPQGFKTAVALRNLNP
jgi:hypothetical protein